MRRFLLTHEIILFFIYDILMMFNAPYEICREADITKERIQKVLGAGANVVLVSGGIDDLCLKYFVEAGAMGVRRCKKADLKRIARATGGKIYSGCCFTSIIVPLYIIKGLNKCKI